MLDLFSKNTHNLNTASGEELVWGSNYSDEVLLPFNMITEMSINKTKTATTKLHVGNELFFINIVNCDVLVSENESLEVIYLDGQKHEDYLVFNTECGKKLNLGPIDMTQLKEIIIDCQSGKGLLQLNEKGYTKALPDSQASLTNPFKGRGFFHFFRINESGVKSDDEPKVFFESMDNESATEFPEFVLCGESKGIIEKNLNRITNHGKIQSVRVQAFDSNHCFVKFDMEDDETIILGYLMKVSIPSYAKDALK